MPTLCRTVVPAVLGLLAATRAAPGQRGTFQLTQREYLRNGGAEVMAFSDYYPEGHQGGVSIVQHGVRVASNGDLRLEPTPGQWSPVPRQLRQEVHAAEREIITWLTYPDTAQNRHGFNPIEYPDLKLSYRVRVRADGDAVLVIVDLDRPLPPADSRAR